MAENLLEIERVLAGSEACEVVSIDEVPTISIPDALRVATAVKNDVASNSLVDRYGIPKYCIVPTEDLSEAIEEHPFAGGYGAEHYGGLDYARGLALHEFNLLAQLEGFSGYQAYRRAQPEHVRKAHNNIHWRLFDGFLAYDLESRSGREGAVPESWEELIARYGAEDAVVLGYMQKATEVLRIDASRHFRYLDPTPFLDFDVDSDEVFYRKEKIGRVMNQFLIDNGFKPKAPDIAVVDMDSDTVGHLEINEEGDKVLTVDQQG